jgi:hypothetical protein
VKFSVPIRVQGPNLREHHFARMRRVQKERASVVGSCLVQCGPDRRSVGGRCGSNAAHVGWRQKISPPYVVTLTRVGKRLLDDDNLHGACKAVRDQVAQMLGCGDGPDDPITWRYAQRNGEYAVEVEIQSVNAGVA